MKDKIKIAEAVGSSRKGDSFAMKYLYEIFAKEMLTLSYRITANLKDAEDVIQESFIHSFSVLGQLKDDANFGPWLKRIVLNNSLKRVKKRQLHLPLKHEQLEETYQDSTWYESIPFSVVQEAIQNLPNGCREVLTLFLLDDYKHREISEMLEISVSTSKSQYLYGLKMLRNNLKIRANE